MLSGEVALFYTYLGSIPCNVGVSWSPFSLSALCYLSSAAILHWEKLCLI